MVDAKARQDCIKEIELLQSLDHPNIISYLASFVDSNEVFIVTNLVILINNNILFVFSSCTLFLSWLKLATCRE